MGGRTEASGKMEEFEEDLDLVPVAACIASLLYEA